MSSKPSAHAQQFSTLIITPSTLEVLLRTPSQLNLPSNFVTVIDDITMNVKDDGSAGDIVVSIIDQVDFNVYAQLGKSFSASEMDTLSKSWPGGLPLLPATAVSNTTYGNQISTAAYSFKATINGNVHASAAMYLTVTYHFVPASQLR